MSFFKFRIFLSFLFLVLYCMMPLVVTSAIAEEQKKIFPLERYRILGEKEGLNSKIIYMTIQDRDGFIWLGTNAGVFRYDGRSFQRYTVDDGIMDNEVFSIYEDSKDRIWFLTFNGRLSFWKDGIIHNPANTPFLKNTYLEESFFSSYEDSHGRIWFGTLNGFVVIKDDSVVIIKSKSNLNKVNSVYVHEDLKGNIWSFNKNKMFKILDKNSTDSIFIPDDIIFRRVCHGPDKVMYYYNDSGIFKIYDQSYALIVDKKLMPPVNKIINIFSNGEYIWLCTVGQGCYEFKNGKLNKIYFSGKTITSAFRDRENNLWFGTLANTLLMVPSTNESVTNYTQSTGLSYDVVNSISSSGNDSVWLGYGNGMVDIISNNMKSTINLAGSNDSNYYRVSNIIADPEVTWIGSDLGIFFIENGKLTHIKYTNNKKAPTSYSVKRFIKDSSGDIYATYSYNLLKVEKNKSGLNVREVLDSIRRTFSIVEINKGEYIVSSLSGLLKYIPGQKTTNYITDTDLSSVRIIDMKLDGDTNLLMASDGFGFYIFKNGKIKQHFSLAEGLADNICNRITVAGEYVYVSTNSGLSILKKEKGKYYITGNITTLNGLQSNAVNDVAIKNPFIYIATDKGLTVINLDKYSAPSFIGKIKITEIITDTVQALASSCYEYRSDIPRLLIKYAYPVFNPANLLQTRYRLLKDENDNTEWIISENNKIEFSSLEPGKYILQLKPGSTNDINSITKFNFSITPLWWQTLLAKVTISLLILLLLAMMLRKRMQKVYEKEVMRLKEQTILEMERNRIASDMHDDIGADLTKISIWANILDTNQSDTKETIKKITQSSEEVLQKMDEIIWALNAVRNSSTDLISYLRMFATRFLEDTGIKLNFVAKKNIPDLIVTYIQRRNIFLVLKELLHNSVKHSHAENISIDIMYENDQLIFHYNDDGNGCDLETNSGGFGIQNMQHRMNEINAVFNILSKSGKGFSASILVNLIHAH